VVWSRPVPETHDPAALKAGATLIRRRSSGKSRESRTAHSSHFLLAHTSVRYALSRRRNDMRDAKLDKQSEPADKNKEADTPGSKGYPEPGSGHDESETVTVEDGPPIRKTDGVPGAFGDVEIDRQP
jgi:hypothetical protein